MWPLNENEFDTSVVEELVIVQNSSGEAKLVLVAVGAVGSIKRVVSTKCTLS